jgi:hypothetical protein
VKQKVSLVFVLGLFVLFGLGRVSAADTQPLAVAMSYEAALSAADFDGLSGLFAEDATYRETVGGQPIAGRDAIRERLAQRHSDSRQYEVVAVSLNGDQLTMTVDITDRGVTWGRHTLRATVEDGLISALETVSFRFLF